MTEQGRQTATLGGGCFWCLSAIYEKVAGVESVVSGYCGGQPADPDYGAVCSGQTGHAEVVQIGFDPAVISFEELLELFFAFHDPTTLNRQGNDVGTQYRSVIFHHSEQQREAAQSMIAQLGQLDSERAWQSPIVTEVLPAMPFYAAEDYHQHYFSKNPGQGYCQVIIAPKLAKLRAKYAARLNR